MLQLLAMEKILRAVIISLSKMPGAQRGAKKDMHALLLAKIHLLTKDRLSLTKTSLEVVNKYVKI